MLRPTFFSSGVHLDDLELVLLTDFELRSASPVLVDCFGDVAQALDALGDLNESAELRGAQHLAVHHIADAVRREERLPDIGLKLLDAQRQAAILAARRRERLP